MTYWDIGGPGLKSADRISWKPKGETDSRRKELSVGSDAPESSSGMGPGRGPWVQEGGCHSCPALQQSLWSDWSTCKTKWEERNEYKSLFYLSLNIQEQLEEGIDDKQFFKMAERVSTCLNSVIQFPYLTNNLKTVWSHGKNRIPISKANA